MKNKCYEFGELQAFLDGEMENTRSEAAARHISDCAVCALQITELEHESDSVFAAIGSELDVLVPTERLKSKVFASIHEFEQKEKRSFWRKLISLSTANPIFAQPASAFAVITVMVAIGFVGLSYFDKPEQSSTIAAAPTVQDNPVNTEVVSDQTEPDITVQQDFAVKQQIKTATEDTVSKPVEFATAIHRVEPARVQTDVRRSVPVVKPAEAYEDNRFPSSEAGYIRTITALNRTVNENKDYVLRPSERVVFERDLAVVNDAIRKMRSEVKNNPKNSAAREVLQSSYENKIDLLNSVAQRSNTSAAFD